MDLNIDIIAVGKLREPFYRDADLEYEKRLSRYARVHVIEVEEVKKPDEISPALSVQIREKEAERMQRFLKPGAFVVALCIEGQEMDSVSGASQSGHWVYPARTACKSDTEGVVTLTHLQSLAW